MKDKKSASLFQKEQVMESLKQSFVKLDPRVMIKNPIMFTVELVTLVMLVVCILSLGELRNMEHLGTTFWCSSFSLVTCCSPTSLRPLPRLVVRFQAGQLRKRVRRLPPVLIDGKARYISSARLKKGDYFICEAGRPIP